MRKDRETNYIDYMFSKYNHKKKKFKATHSYWPFNPHQWYLWKYNKPFRYSMYLHIGTICSSKIVIEAILMFNDYS